MKIKVLLLSCALLTLQFVAYGQNYLRVTNPDFWWGAPLSSEPGWADYLPHGIFEEVSLVVSPKGIYTEIEMYATITNGPDVWSSEYEIIWQFDLPAKTIVHDSWLWVEDEIIRADVVDFWTALATYEGIVDRNQDPSFLYILPDNRYEIRIYPLFEGESRRIKLSFLVPAVWNQQTVTQDLLQHLFQSTDYPIGQVSVAMPMDTVWGTPRLQLGTEEFIMSETVVGGNGDELHYLEISGDDLSHASEISMVWEAPLTGPDRTFLSTYTDGSAQFYQLAYLPDWEAAYENPSPDKALILVDYKASKTTTTLEEFNDLLLQQLDAHFSSNDAVNVAISTTMGVRFLDPAAWRSADENLADELAQLLALQDTSNLALLLNEGLSWVQAQGDATQVYVLAANDDYTYPPVAEELFTDLQPWIDPNLEFFLLDYQNENVSVIYYSDEVYSGNSHLYQLLADAFLSSDVVILREQGTSLGELMRDFFPGLLPPNGVIDYSVRLENGLCFERFNLSGSTLNADNNGVLLQTGKYLGDLPMEIEGFLVTDDDEFFALNAEIPEAEVIPGDSLMTTMWYAQHLEQLFGQVSSNADREHLIDLSISQRILTPLTAFLALEPGLGGEPCVSCLYNNGQVLIFTQEAFELKNAQLSVSPNPATDHAVIRLDHPPDFQAEDWQAIIYDAAGRAICTLPAPQQHDSFTEWTWALDNELQTGIYFCKIASAYGEVTTRVVVIR